jgi:putative SOS response-associated peptidase YedK
MSGRASPGRRHPITLRRVTVARSPSRAYGSIGAILRQTRNASATIIVGPANDWMRPFHDRMPLILDWSDADAWMSGESAAELLRPAPADALQQWTVSARVNRSGVGDDDPSLIEPLEVA